MRVIAVFLFLFLPSAYAEPQCEAAWASAFDRAKKSPAAAIAPWASMEVHCSGDPNYFARLGTLQAMSGDEVAAENSYKKSIELYPKNEFGYTQLAGLRLAQGNHRDVLKQCNTSLNLKPNYVCYRHAAIAFVALQKPGRAIELFGLAYEQNDKALADTDLMTNVAMAYADSKKWELARNSLAVLIQKNPSAEQTKNFSIALDYVKKALADNGVTSVK